MLYQSFVKYIMVGKSFRHSGDFSTSNIFFFENGKLWKTYFRKFLFVALLELFDRVKIAEL